MVKVGSTASMKLRKLITVDLLTFSHGSNQNKQEGCVTLIWLMAVSSAISVL